MSAGPSAGPTGQRVAVVGGGFAGLAAAVRLAEQGFVVSVLEARKQLGGRARSFRDRASGAVIDNGQHAMMGCYSSTLGFLERIGTTAKLRRQPNLCVPMIHAQRGRGEIRCPALPGPLHAAAGLLGFRLLGRRERVGALLGGLRIAAMRTRRDARLAELSVAELLASVGQSSEACRSLWFPLAIATCNEAPDRVAAAPFAEVLGLALFGSRADSQFVFPGVGLSELYTDAARSFVERRGGEVRCGADVRGLVLDGGRLSAVALRDGSRVPADACILAVPPHALPPLLPGELRTTPGLRGIDRLESSPIVSVHLWLDRPVLETDFVGLVGTTTQWLFDRTRLCGAAPAEAGHCLSAVISAGQGVVEQDGEAIARTVLADLRSLLPGARDARLLHRVVVKERRATLSATPEATRLRPGATTPIDNLFLAGDWTDTGLPPTIESAVRSAERAAALAARRLRTAARP